MVSISPIAAANIRAVSLPFHFLSYGLRFGCGVVFDDKSQYDFNEFLIISFPTM
ncbi:hypothetical protein HMPREF3039_02201 [Akkermansia sp. KLE1798]|nr:hypothetical protein HMPREF3039_02201 [Akkermansia sp. KLE1798]